MNFFKKLTILFICAVSVFSTACTGQTKIYQLFGGSYWLSDTTAGGVVPVYEKCIYTVSTTSSTNETLSLELGESSFTTTLETVVYNELNCYKFSTELSLTGNYKGTDGKTVEINDFQKSECYFLGLSDKFAPLYSVKTVSSVTPVESEEDYSFPKIEYTSECTYDKTSGKANVKVTTGENMNETYKFLAHEKVYEKYNANTFIDNELFLFLPRACQFEEGFSQSFYTLDVLGQKILPMRISVSTQQPKTEISLKSFKINDKPLATETNLKVFPVYNVLIQINSNFSGRAIEYCYTTTENDNRNRLISFKQQLPVSLGDLKFTLAEIFTEKSN